MYVYMCVKCIGMCVCVHVLLRCNWVCELCIHKWVAKVDRSDEVFVVHQFLFFLSIYQCTVFMLGLGVEEKPGEWMVGRPELRGATGGGLG